MQYFEHTGYSTIHFKCTLQVLDVDIGSECTGGCPLILAVSVPRQAPVPPVVPTSVTFDPAAPNSFLLKANIAVPDLAWSVPADLTLVALPAPNSTGIPLSQCSVFGIPNLLFSWAMMYLQTFSTCCHRLGDFQVESVVQSHFKEICFVAQEIHGTGAYYKYYLHGFGTVLHRVCICDCIWYNCAVVGWNG